MTSFWNWLTANAPALQSLAALVGEALTFLTIVVLIVTWRAIKAQADAARALIRVATEQTEVARQQTESIKGQADAALKSVSATNAANRISEEANRLSVERMRADLLPILIFNYALDQPIHVTKNVIRNVGRGPAKDVQISVGRAKDEAPKTYIPSRTLIGSGDEVSFEINRELFKKTGMTIHYASLDGRRLVSSVYIYEGSIKHDFEEL